MASQAEVGWEAVQAVRLGRRMIDLTIATLFLANAVITPPPLPWLTSVHGGNESAPA